MRDWRWLFMFLSRHRWLASDRTYYWLLDRLTDNNGWRPLDMRCPEHFGKGKP